jgi:DNA helicase-2/ATP-dependent DNA helicase PcrA
VIDAEHLLTDLTESQRAAAMHVDGPLLIIAAAGSGKTRVITRRVAHLITLGIPANSILAITFTNKAAGEMKHRVASVCGNSLHDFGKLDQPWPMICTFHSLCLRILKHYAPEIGLAPNFSIFDSADQNRLIKDALKTLEISTDNFPPASAHAAISNAKNKLITADAFAQSAGDFHERTIARIYTKYQQLLDQNNALDFDDLLLRTTLAFRAHPPMLGELQDRFRYLMIDEYQDTNHVQYILAHALALKLRNICVVGDPDQSIYAWRGADIQNILDFEKDYPDATIVKLEQNYRSTKTILYLASTLISHNLRRREKALWTENAQGAKARLFLCMDEYDEADQISRELRRLRDEGYDWNQMAVFYRVNALSRVMEKSLFAAQIPYQIARGVEFYGRKEIKDVLAYLRVIANPSDEVSLERIVNVPTRGIGDSAMKLVQTHAIGNGMSLFAAMDRCGQISGLSKRAANSIRAFVEMINDWRESAGASVRDLMENIVQKSGLEASLKKLGGDEQEQMANINELITSALEYDNQNPEGSLDGYLSQVSLVSDVDRLSDAGGAVTLMTLHAAKGLEFPVVAIIGLEDGCLPHSRARDNIDQMEEERRLCFVGITRAQERVVLSKASVRTVRGLRAPTIASPFLKQLPKDAIEIIDHSAMTNSRGGWQSRGISQNRDQDGDSGYRDDDFSQEPQYGEFHRGQMVKHPMFGVGKIADVSETGSKVVVDFKLAGRKTLMVEHAKLQALG